MTSERDTPAAEGFRLPADTEPHERCVMAWPTLRRVDLWHGHLGAARDAFAIVARAINEYEPVTVVADQGEGRAAEQWLGGQVEVVELALDHCRVRDTAPAVLCHADGRRTAVHFGFNGWGGRLDPHDRDAGVGAALAGHLGLPCRSAPFVLEGGAVVGDGAGTLVTTEQCLLHPSRNPGRDQDELEALLLAWLGAERVVWLTTGLADDLATDGHVSNVVTFAGPGRAVLQTTSDADDPDAGAMRDSHARLEAAGIEVLAIDVLPHVECFDRIVEVPYVSLYAGNGAVFVPLAGAAADKAVLRQLDQAYPGRDVVGVPGTVLAYGGTGVRAITAPVPAPMAGAGAAGVAGEDR